MARSCFRSFRLRRRLEVVDVTEDAEEVFLDVVAEDRFRFFLGDRIVGLALLRLTTDLWGDIRVM